MKEIRILHLLPNMLSLYGEYGNVAILERVLTQQGFSVVKEIWESGPLTPDAYDFIYIGSGTEDNLKEAIKCLAPHTRAIQDSIENGTYWLATGNAMVIFGRDALDVLPYESATQNTQRFMGDVITGDAFGAPLVGYVNTSSEYYGIEAPLFRLRYGLGLGNRKGAVSDEGICYKHFFGTQLLGPVLVKNPHFLSAIAGELTGEPLHLDPESNLCKAYTVTLQELKKRAGF